MLPDNTLCCRSAAHFRKCRKTQSHVAFKSVRERRFFCRHSVPLSLRPIAICVDGNSRMSLSGPVSIVSLLCSYCLSAGCYAPNRCNCGHAMPDRTKSHILRPQPWENARRPITVVYSARMNTDDAYKPIQRATLSEASWRILRIARSVELRHPVSHETALAIWGVELPTDSDCSAFSLRSSQVDYVGEDVDYGWNEEDPEGPTFGHSGCSVPFGRDFSDLDFQDSPDFQVFSREQVSELRRSGSQYSRSSQSLPRATAKLHTVAQSPARRGRVRKSTSRSADVTVHVWKGLSARHVREVAGVPVLMPVPSWALAAGRWGIQDVVMVAESLIRHRLATREELIRFVETENVPYRSKCLDALELVQSGSDSPKETEMRLVLVRYGLPIMRPNCVVPGVNFANGAVVTLDLVDAEHRFGLDYQGDHHRTDRAQYRRDQNKLSRLAAAGWTVFSVTQLDLSDELHRAAFAMNVAHALSSIAGRPIGVTTPLPWRKVVLRYRKARKLGLLD